MKYISLFSGIGGLEAASPPELLCEMDPAAASVLRHQYPDVPVFPDVRGLDPPSVDVVAGGWPCQDLSIAGKQAGLDGERSGLLFDMLRLAKRARATTVVAENVPNLLRLNDGREFDLTLRAFQDFGFNFVAWRLLNAREFGLPQNRSRLLLVASRDVETSLTLFRDLPELSPEALVDSDADSAAGFYWTAGTHSINYSRGYVPAIKVGSSLKIASPPAIHYDEVVRLITPTEALRLQGFDLSESLFESSTAAYRAAGNAVARPIGKWVLDGVAAGRGPVAVDWVPTQPPLWQEMDPANVHPTSGLFADGETREVALVRAPRVTNLASVIDRSCSVRVSPRAARGLLDRLTRSGQSCPESLSALLANIATAKAA